MINRVLRLNLCDFIATPLETDVIQAIEHIHNNESILFVIQLWYVPRLVTSDKLQKFQRENCQVIQEHDIKIKQFDGYEEMVWYDIIGKKDEAKLTKFKFRLLYDCETQIPTKLMEFNNFVKNYPAHLQRKNNGYEKNSSHRLNNVGKPSRN